MLSKITRILYPVKLLIKHEGRIKIYKNMLAFIFCLLCSFSHAGSYWRVCSTKIEKMKIQVNETGDTGRPSKSRGLVMKEEPRIKIMPCIPCGN